MQFFFNELCHENKKTFFRGIALAEEINSPIVYQECASILEEIKVIILPIIFPLNEYLYIFI